MTSANFWNLVTLKWVLFTRLLDKSSFFWIAEIVFFYSLYILVQIFLAIYYVVLAIIVWHIDIVLHHLIFRFITFQFSVLCWMCKKQCLHASVCDCVSIEASSDTFSFDTAQFGLFRPKYFIGFCCCIYCFIYALGISVKYIFTMFHLISNSQFYLHCLNTFEQWINWLSAWLQLNCYKFICSFPYILFPLTRPHTK